MSGDLPNAGDLARVVRVCVCGQTEMRMDRFIRVTSIEILLAFCMKCGDSLYGEHVHYEGAEQHQCYPRSWTRRIPPLSELESIDIVSEIEGEMPRREKVPA